MSHADWTYFTSSLAVATPTAPNGPPRAAMVTVAKDATKSDRFANADMAQLFRNDRRSIPARVYRRNGVTGPTARLGQEGS